MQRKSLTSLIGELYRLFSHLIQNPRAPLYLAVSVADHPSPYADIVETPHEVSLTLELPGISADKVAVAADRRTVEVQVAGTDRMHPSASEGAHTYSLPADIEPKKLHITFHNGILAISAEKVRREHISIN